MKKIYSIAGSIQEGLSGSFIKEKLSWTEALMELQIADQNAVRVPVECREGQYLIAIDELFSCAEDECFPLNRVTFEHFRLNAEHNKMLIANDELVKVQVNQISYSEKDFGTIEKDTYLLKLTGELEAYCRFAQSMTS